jgi:glycosyltransferase involved in cell wall biosynthesis
MERFLDLPWLKRLLTSAGAVVPANSETLELLQRHHVAAKEVILDTGAPESALAEPRLGLPGEIRLMYAGQLERRKGIELSLRALAQVDTQNGCNWTFDVFGDGPDRRRLALLATQLGIADNVTFHGAVPRAKLMSQFKEADAFLFTSVRDTSGGVNLEAMAHGLPLICLAHQGVGDITDNHCAERVPPGTIEETISGLANAITTLAADPARRVEMGQAAAKRAVECFSWNEKFERMCVHYQDAINQRSSMSLP